MGAARIVDISDYTDPQGVFFYSDLISDHRIDIKKLEYANPLVNIPSVNCILPRLGICGVIAQIRLQQ